MKIQVVSFGTGGGNVVKDIVLRRRKRIGNGDEVQYLFTDTHEFSLEQIRAELGEADTFVLGERLLGGAGSGMDDAAAVAAFEESRETLRAKTDKTNVLFPVASGGKTTGLNSIFPFTKMAWDMGIFTVPVFIMPSFDGGEVTLSRYRKAAGVIKQFDESNIRVLVVLNDVAYEDADAKMEDAYSVLNAPLAEGLDALLDFFRVPGDVDFADLLKQVVCGTGRYRIGAATIPPLGDGDAEFKTAAVRAAKAVRMFEFGSAFDRTEPGGALVFTRGDFTAGELKLLRTTIREQFEREADGKPIANLIFGRYPADGERTVTVFAGERLTGEIRLPEFTSLKTCAVSVSARSLVEMPTAPSDAEVSAAMNVLRPPEEPAAPQPTVRPSCVRSQDQIVLMRGWYDGKEGARPCPRWLRERWHSATNLTEFRAAQQEFREAGSVPPDIPSELLLPLEENGNGHNGRRRWSLSSLLSLFPRREAAT